jgi:hypothetical protein
MAYRILQTSVLLILAILTTGCASNLKMTYKSSPGLASIYEGGKELGVAPVTVEYAVTKDDKKRGNMLLRGTSARWVSGASAEVPSVRVDLKNGLSQEITFNRPENYPGLEKDQAFVREVIKTYLLLRQVQAQERQAQAQEDIVNIQRDKQLTDSINQIGKPQTPYPLPRPPTNCTSTVVGNTVRTTCQ